MALAYPFPRVLSTELVLEWGLTCMVDGLKAALKWFLHGFLGTNSSAARITRGIIIQKSPFFREEVEEA